MNKNILITGGAGYLGSVLTRKLLNDGYSVRVIDNLRYGGSSLLGVFSYDNLEFIKQDVTKNGVLVDILEDIDIVIHLAALVGDPICSKYPVLAKKTNLDATKKIIDLSKKQRVQLFIFASTCSNYGISDTSTLATEDSPLNPVSLYAKTKVNSEKYLLSSINTNFAGVVMRLSTVFGISPRMRFDLTVNHFTKDAFINKNLVIYGEETWRPYIHVYDVARAFEIICNSKTRALNGEIFNVGSNDQNFQKKEIAQLVKKQIPDAKLEFTKKDIDDPRNYRVSFDKIRNKLGFQTTKSIEEGICEIKGALENKIITDLDNKSYYNVRDG